MITHFTTNMILFYELGDSPRGPTLSEMKTDSTDAICRPFCLPPLPCRRVTVIVGRAYWQRQYDRCFTKILHETIVFRNRRRRKTRMTARSGQLFSTGKYSAVQAIVDRPTDDQRSNRCCINYSTDLLIYCPTVSDD